MYDFFVKMQLHVINVFVSLPVTIIPDRLQKIHKNGSTEQIHSHVVQKASRMMKSIKALLIGKGRTILNIPVNVV